MKIQTWLAIKKNGWRTSVRTTKTKPKLDFNEISLKLELDLPDALFTTPALEASIVIPASSVQNPIISAEVTDNIVEAIQTATGVQVKLIVQKAEEEDEDEE